MELALFLFNAVSKQTRNPRMEENTKCDHVFPNDRDQLEYRKLPSSFVEAEIWRLLGYKVAVTQYGDHCFRRNLDLAMSSSRWLPLYPAAKNIPQGCP